MEVTAVSQEEILSFISLTLVPILVDVLRVGTFQILMRLKMYDFANATTGSKFGLLSTLIVSGVFGLFVSIWFGLTDPTFASIAENSFIVLGVSQVIYKGVYEKSDVRKSVVGLLDKIGPTSEQIDTPETETTVG